MLSKECNNDITKLRNADEEFLSAIEGIGPVIARSIVDYFKIEKNNKQLDHLLSFLELEEVKEAQNKIFENINFVITGSVEQYPNRNAVKEVIETLGGKVTGSVTSKTNYLINNDTTSNSSKNKKAKDLGVPIISELDFIKMLEGQRKE